MNRWQDACRQLGRFLIQFYMHKRIHSALGYLTPAEFESQWRSRQAPINQELAKAHTNP